MPLHDWTRVHAGEYHAFHNAWIAALQGAMNNGGLPDGYYALGEQQAKEPPAADDGDDARAYGPDVLTLARQGEDDLDESSPDAGGLAVAQAPPKLSLRGRGQPGSVYARLRRTLAIRHVSRDRPVALLEIASPGNKDRASAVAAFVDKCATALGHGLHVAVIDPFPPRPSDPRGLAIAVAEASGVGGLDDADGDRVPAASFEAGDLVQAYAETFDVGDAWPPLPLFYRPGWYVELPLETTYAHALTGLPSHLRRAVGA